MIQKSLKYFLCEHCSASYIIIPNSIKQNFKKNEKILKMKKK